MAEVYFYHLTRSPLEAALPELLEICQKRDLKVVVNCGVAERVAFLDQILWTYKEDSFLAHGLDSQPQAAAQPCLLSTTNTLANGADILMLVDGAQADETALQQFSRTCILFDGNDPAALDAARKDWKRVVAAKIPAKYWSQESGSWKQAAASAPE